MDKGTRVADVETVIEATAQAGIKNHVFVVFGFPTETTWEMQATLELLRKHRSAIAMVHRSPFQLEPDTPICDNLAKFSITRTWPPRRPACSR